MKDEKWCMSVKLIGEQKIPTYQVVLDKTFLSMTYDIGNSYLEDATLTQANGMYIIEGYELSSYVPKVSETFTKDQIDLYRKSEESFKKGVPAHFTSDELRGGVVLGDYIATARIVYLLETRKVRYECKNIVYKQFVDL